MKNIKRLKRVGSRPRAAHLQRAAQHSWLFDDRVVNESELKTSVLKRVAPAVRELVHSVSDAQLLEALSTSTSIDALIHLVSRDAAVGRVAAKLEDPLRDARARAAKKMAELIAADGGPIGVEDVAGILRISRAAVDKRRKKGTLIGIEDGGRSILYPVWQFTNTGLLPGIEDSLKVISVDPWMRMQFFLTKDAELGERPLDLLRRGAIDPVVRAAGRFARFGEDA